MDVVPDWVKVASITEFKQHCAQHCETDAEIKHFIALRRKIKNRVSGKFDNLKTFFFNKSSIVRKLQKDLGNLTSKECVRPEQLSVQSIPWFQVGLKSQMIRNSNVKQNFIVQTNAQ